MADAYIEDDYNPKKRNRRPRKRPRWPFVILGFLIGFITLPALISLTVLLIVNRPVEKTVNTIDKITNVGLYEMLFGTEGENGEDGKLGYLDDRYGEMKLKDALGDIVDIAQKGNQLTFNDLATISPQVEKAVDELVQAAEEKSIILDKMELMATPLSGFSDLLMDEVKEIQLGEVLLAVKPDIFEDESTGAILKNLFFGRAEINYTESDGVIEMLPITYTYDAQTDTFVCVDETVYKYNGEVWETEDGGYISKSGDAFAFYSSYGDLLYQLQPSENKSMTFYTAVTVNSEGIIEYVKQQSLALGSFMGDGDPMAIIGKLELGVLLGINSQEAAESDNNNMLVALAYGTYGVDYTFENGKVTPVLGGKDFTTLGDLMGSPDEVLNNVQLGAMLGIKTRTDAEKDGNEMLVALAYGTYGIDFEYDLDGTIIPKDGGREFTTLGALINEPNDILNGIQLGSLLGISTRAEAEKDGNEMLVALAYGTYGVDFEYDAQDNVIPMSGGKEFTTLGSLIENPNDVLNSIQLGSMLGITTRTEAEKDGNEMLVALAYGTYGVDFEYDINGNIIAKDGGKDFTTLGELINHSDQILDGIQLGALLGIKTRADVDSGEHDMMIAIAYGTYDVDFEYDADDNIIPKAGGEPFTTLGELLDSPDAVLQGVQVGALLGITTKEDVEKSDSLMVSLAYGTYDVDFEYDSNNKIVAKAGGKPFTTVATLMDPDEVNTILEDIPLSTIFTVDIFDPNADALTVSLIYGTAGKHYVIAEENGEKYIDWQIDPDTGAPYSERTFGDIRQGNLTDFVNDLKVGDVFELTATSPKLLVAIQDWYVSDLGKQEKINSLQLKDVIDVGTEGVLAEMGEWQIGEISESKIKSIKLSSVLNVNAGDTGLIASLANKKDDAGNPWTIGHLTEANVQNLTVGEVLPSALGADAETDFFAALKDAKIGDLNATYIKEQLTIGQVLGIKTTDEGILATFANYKVGDFTEGALKSELTIGDVIDADAHPILGKLANTPLDQVDNAAIENALNDLQLSEVIEIDHPLFKYMATKKLGEIDATFIDGIKVKDALGIESTTDPILTQIMDLKLGDLKDSTLLKDKITNLQLNQLLEVSGIPVLEQLGSYKLNELDEETINELKICEILGIEDPDSDFYFKHLKTSTIGTMVSDIDNLTVVQLFEDTMEYDEHGNITGTWKYLLTWNWDDTVADAPNKDYVAPDKYKVSDMAAMIENMHNNIEHATLWDLHDDKLAAHLDEETLNAELVYRIAGVDFSTQVKAITGITTIVDADDNGTIDNATVGDLNVLQVSQYLSLVLNAIQGNISGVL